MEHIVVALKPNEKMNPISRSESANRVGLVFVYSTNQMFGDANVECPVLAIRQNVNVVHDRTGWGYGFRARACGAPRNDETYERA